MKLDEELIALQAPKAMVRDVRKELGDLPFQHVHRMPSGTFIIQTQNHLDHIKVFVWRQGGRTKFEAVALEVVRPKASWWDTATTEEIIQSIHDFHVQNAAGSHG